MNVSISSAISGRQLIEFDYDGHHRVVEPAAHGPHVSSGNHVLRGHQVAGTGKTRAVPFWDLFLVSKMTNLQVTSTTFNSDPPGYVRGDKHIQVHCEL